MKIENDLLVFNDSGGCQHKIPWKVVLFADIANRGSALAIYFTGGGGGLVGGLIRPKMLGILLMRK